MAAQTPDQLEINMDPNELYREETVTDHKVGTIRVMIPITSDGSDDSSRETQYHGQTQIMTPMGALPISFEIEASSIGEAAEKFGDAAKVGIEKTMEELKEMQRQASSSIVVPGSGGGGMGGLGGMGGAGGLPGGGKIQIP